MESNFLRYSLLLRYFYGARQNPISFPTCVSAYIKFYYGGHNRYFFWALYYKKYHRALVEENNNTNNNTK